MKLYSCEINSPVGKIKMVVSDQAVVAILWEGDRQGRVPLAPVEINPQHPLILQLETQLQEYFAGKRSLFDLPLAPLGTEFQKQVWQALRNIPYGKTQSYGELAKAIGRPKAARAVGAANGKNPISIVIPCHRVIGANGDLTGFAGGLKAKEILLNLECKSHP